MVRKEKENGFINIIKEGLKSFLQIISSSVFPKIAEGAESIMDHIEERIVRIEKRIMKKIYITSIIGIGVLFLIFAVFFLLKDSLGWSNAAGFFAIGITIFVIGLLLKIKESNNKDT